MNKTAQTEMHRLFLIEGLPDPLTPASSHVQIFDNYIAGTRMRLRRIRDPYSNSWTRILQQRFPSGEDEGALTRLAEICLHDHEYVVMERLGAAEIRKNRYFHEIDAVSMAFDVYLGDLRQLTTARVEFESLEKLEQYIPPPLAVFEITTEAFFAGENLVGKNLDDIRAEVRRLGASAPIVNEMPDE